MIQSGHTHLRGQPPAPTALGQGALSNPKMRFQSFFMLITVQPSFFASSYKSSVNVPTLVLGKPLAGP